MTATNGRSKEEESLQKSANTGNNGRFSLRKVFPVRYDNFERIFKGVSLWRLVCTLILLHILTSSLVLICFWGTPGMEFAVLENQCLRIASNLENNLEIYDDSMQYKILPFAFVGLKWPAAASESVCITTHSSMTRIHLLAESLLSWKAAASVAIYAPGPEFQTLQYFIGYLQYCYPKALLYASIHLVYPIERPPIEASSLHGMYYDCSLDPKSYIREQMATIGLSAEEQNDTEIIYPQNILRNAAIKMCPTEWILSLDVDMIPQPSLHQRLERYLTDEETNCSKCAFVIPTYEVQLPRDSTPMVERLPDTKEDLLRLIVDELATPFHGRICPENQGPSKLAEWEMQALYPNDDIHVAYTVNYEFWYEPVFIAKRGFPLYVERFVGFGMTRNTQAYEMFLSGYKFKLLDNAYLVHWGFQSLDDRTSWRKKQQSNNKELAKTWILQMMIKYDTDPLNLTAAVIQSQAKRKFIVSKNKIPGWMYNRAYMFPYLYFHPS